MMPRGVHAVVVAYGVPEGLRGSASTLGQEIPLTVVDNSSSSEVRALARSRGATYLDPGKNLGFASAVNLALRNVVTKQRNDVLLLNPDAVLGEEHLRALSAQLHRPSNERVAAVSPLLVGRDGTPQRVQWPFPSPGRAWLEAVGLGRRQSRRTFVVGAVLLLRWEALQEVGLFDERFFLYAEEADWQRRAVDLGWTSQVCANATATHAGAASSNDPHRRDVLFHAAQETYIRKWYGQRGWLIYRAAAVAGAAARIVALAGDRRADAARRALLYLRGPRRCAALGQD
ncbi:MAG: glycosyltransferase family 2 protein [Acidobacteria bacterium]|nr:glycosyltransferase family 2 protein [Acidobacteriota bacterium]